MKKLFFILVLIIASPVFVCGQDIIADSKINQVTVYTQGALINRIASFKLNDGTKKIIFPEIIPQIDENSLRVSGEGSAEVKILGASFKKEFLNEVKRETSGRTDMRCLILLSFIFTRLGWEYQKLLGQKNNK